MARREEQERETARLARERPPKKVFADRIIESPEVRARLSQKEAIVEIRRVVGAIAPIASTMGAGQKLDWQTNGDGSVDAHLKMFAPEEFFEGRRAEALRDFLFALVPGFSAAGMSGEVWYSARLFYSASVPLDEQGAAIVQGSGRAGTTMEIEPDEECDEDEVDMMKTRRAEHALNYQRDPLRAFGHMEAASEHGKNFLVRNELLGPVITCIALRLHWNPYLATPTRLRLLP